MKDAKLNLMLPSELLARLKEEADRNYVSVSAMVRIMISAYLSADEK